MSLRPLTGAQRLRDLLKDPNKIVLCPGVFDGLTARLALDVGFDALYMVQIPMPRSLMIADTLNRLEQARRCLASVGQI